ncbi:MAG: hypothetical protein F4Y00_08795 [Bacteroidetes bacterium SB0662_bin_6]|nr:hypothetical protein [Bacteroidetes bacterium SB0662_bin_6]
MSRILLPLDDPNRTDPTPGKLLLSLEDNILTPPGAGDSWFEIYDAWIADTTGEAEPPRGYEEWDEPCAVEDYDAEHERLVNRMKELWGDRWGTWEEE